jgi:sortase B
MKKNKTLDIICIALAVVTLLFAGLAIKNVITGKKESDGISSEAAAVAFSGEVETDSLGTKLSSLVANNIKNASYPDGILDSLKAAYAASSNIEGWLTIPGTEIDTAVMQGSDNSRYLKYDFYERYTTETSSLNYGNIYLDYRCRNDGVLSKNMVIHGHTTGKSDGIPKQSFRSLYNYQDAEYYKEHPIIKFSTLYGEYTYKICAVFYSTTQSSADNGYFFNYIYPDMSDSNMTGYIKQVKERMLYDTGVSLENTDNIITLSTCIYVYGKSVDTRLVVVGRLLHEGEDETVDTSLVKDNPDYRRPQVWYSNNGKTNPYKNSEKWQPSAE